MALHVLRKVDQNVLAELQNPSQGIDHLYLDAKQDWFKQGYLNDAYPRAAVVTDAIMAATEGFVVWADGEGVVASYPDHASAMAAKDGAKLTLQVHVADLPEPTPDAAESGAVAV